ncbi:hypothetical protein G3K90_002249 [Salmonella enterica]|nr:hypothetical protein [Salmonella enterica]
MITVGRIRRTRRHPALIDCLATLRLSGLHATSFDGAQTKKKTLFSVSFLEYWYRGRDLNP